MNHEREFFVNIHRQWDLDGLTVLIGHYRPDGEMAIWKPITPEVQIIKAGEYIPEPTLRLSKFVADPFLRAFADMLHKERIRPTEQSYIEGELMATKKHLTDMQKLVFKKGDSR